MEISLPEGVSTDKAGFPVLLFVVVSKLCAGGSFSRALSWKKIPELKENANLWSSNLKADKHDDVGLALLRLVGLNTGVN